MKLYSYRGEHTVLPQNTMIAFREALMNGAEGIALDVHMTRDRQPVIIHDDALSRTVDAVGLVRHHTLAEIQSARLVEPYAKYNQHVLSLEEYLTWAAPLPHKTIIILCNDAFFYPNLEEEVIHRIEALEGFDAPNRLILASGRLNSLRQMHALYPEIPLAWVPNRLTEERVDILQTSEVKILLPSIERTERTLVEKAHEEGFTILSMDVRDRNQITRLEGLGVDGALVSDVALAREALGVTEMPFKPEELALEEKAPEAETKEKSGTGSMQLLARHAKAMANGKDNKAGRGKNALMIVLAMAICVAIASLLTGLAMNFLKGIFKVS
ncbi:MAG: glycerophosphodiester phosphodiesterase family protein [Peptoniphilaceae bacterium]|nr:glycerophosphodiester phosphodiesterase family protein [Peptoniphilaceae bacterium]